MSHRPASRPPPRQRPHRHRHRGIRILSPPVSRTGDPHPTATGGSASYQHRGQGTASYRHRYPGQGIRILPAPAAGTCILPGPALRVGHPHPTGTAGGDSRPTGTGTRGRDLHLTGTGIAGPHPTGTGIPDKGSAFYRDRHPWQGGSRTPRTPRPGRRTRSAPASADPHRDLCSGSAPRPHRYQRTGIPPTPRPQRPTGTASRAEDPHRDGASPPRRLGSPARPVPEPGAGPARPVPEPGAGPSCAAAAVGASPTIPGASQPSPAAAPHRDPPSAPAAGAFPIHSRNPKAAPEDPHRDRDRHPNALHPSAEPLRHPGGSALPPLPPLG
ncbi:formin-2-like [Zonotrichia leucophrys gambelii]|uniref:formin-2-like n=1 Tax=Zonotrichia leucophrys gambelii TaxID=257770 RepID=UPI003140425B